MATMRRAPELNRFPNGCAFRISGLSRTPPQQVEHCGSPDPPCRPTICCIRFAQMRKLLEKRRQRLRQIISLSCMSPEPAWPTSVGPVHKSLLANHLLDLKKVSGLTVIRYDFVHA